MNNQSTESKETYNISIKIKTQRYYNDTTMSGIFTGFLVKSDKPIELQPIKTKYPPKELQHGSTKQSNDIMIIKGTTYPLKVGETYDIECYEVTDPQWGQQFNIIRTHMNIPVTNEDEQKFLRLFVSERQYDNIIRVYDNPISKLLNNEFNYKLIKSFPYRSYTSLVNKVKDNLICMRVKAALPEYELSLSQVKQLLNTYNTPEIAIQKVKDNPYILFTEVSGWGFKTVDEIALSSGIPYDDPRRIVAAILFVLITNENTKSNCYSLQSEVMNQLEKEFEVPVDYFYEYITDEKLFYTDETRLARRHIYECEKNIAKELLRILGGTKIYLTKDEVTDYIDFIENDLGISYDDKQKELFYGINSNNVLVFTGSAGTGKTTTLNGTLRMLDSKKISYRLLSPTARAAKQVTKSTDRDAATIHRGLGIKVGEDESDDNSIIEEQLVLIDEFSMCDIFIFLKVLKKIRTGTKLLLVGDYAQLESVSIGNILYDLISSGVIPVVQLTKVFRQALNSGILEVATKVRLGEKILNSNDVITYGVKGDCNIWLGTKESVADRVMTIYRDSIENGISPDDIMVLCPTKKSNSGVFNMNLMVQSYINPQCDGKNELPVTREGCGFTFIEGDKVMHTRNNYQAVWLDSDLEPIIDEHKFLPDGGNDYKKGVFNGDIGKIIQIDTNSKNAWVDYGEFIIQYEDLDSLDLSYASTIHKVQGGSAKIVIMAVSFEHFTNLKRSLLYTGITRATDIMYIIAERNALEYAIKNDVMVKKQTFLSELLKTFNSELANN
jgi:RecD/TraA family predicted helicase